MVPKAEEGAPANQRTSFWKLTNDLFERYSSSLHEYLIDFDWTDRDIKKVYEQRKHMVKQMVKSIIFLGKFKVCFRNMVLDVSDGIHTLA